MQNLSINVLLTNYLTTTLKNIHDYNSNHTNTIKNFSMFFNSSRKFILGFWLYINIASYIFLRDVFGCTVRISKDRSGSALL